MGVTEDFDPKYKHHDWPHENYHAYYGNSKNSKVVIIGQNQFETSNIVKGIKMRQDIKVDEVTWIEKPYFDGEDWAKVMKDIEATNIIIDTGDGKNDKDVYDKLRTAMLIPYVVPKGGSVV
jgi:hypothetical protein